MQNRNDLQCLERELYDFLLKDNISSDTAIVNEFIFQLSGAKLAHPESDQDYKHNIGFPFYNRDEEKLKFKLPKLKLDEIYKILNFFRIKYDEYVSGSPLILDPEFVFGELLLKFKAYYQLQKDGNTAEFNKYKIESKAILEANAISTMREHVRKALDMITPKHKPGLPSDLQQVKRGLQVLLANVESLSQYPAQYADIIFSQGEIKSFYQGDYPSVANNPDLEKQLILVSEGIELFKRYHRTESVLANLNFMKEMEAFLRDDEFKISSTQCDVIENSLLSLAGAKRGNQGKCKIRNGYDASRLVFELDDIDKENTEKVLAFLRNAGDETASEGRGYRTHGRSIPEIPESITECAMMSISEKSFFGSAGISKEKYIESHSVEVDGKVFYEKVFPELKKVIIAMEVSDPATLKKYRDDSAPYLKAAAIAEEEIAKKANKAKFFQPRPQIRVPDSDEEECRLGDAPEPMKLEG